MNGLWKRLFSSPSSVDCDLPYNWNWQRSWSAFADFLGQNPIILLDAGARGKPPPELETLRAYIERVGFEPDPTECDRLNAQEEGRFFSVLLAGSSGKKALHLYGDAGYSSVLRLNQRFQELFSGKIPVRELIESNAITIDGFLAEHEELSPDILKLDTQGSELPILQGTIEHLSKIGLVEIEVAFTPLYDEQPLFNEVMSFMVEHEFELLYLNRVMRTRGQVYRGPNRGQLLWADALFGRREDRVGDLSKEQKVKYAILLCQYGHLDIALQLVNLYQLDHDVPELRALFRSSPNQFVRGTLMQFDKLLALALHLRRYNQRGVDTDRAWPIR